MAKEINPLEAENESLKAQLLEKDGIIQALEDSIDGLVNENEELKAAIANAKPGDKPISLSPNEFELDGQTYPFPGPTFILPGFGKVTAEQALENAEILHLLVEMKAGNIN